jgi:hypothetical protein
MLHDAHHSARGLARDPFYFYHLSERCGFVLVSICKNACSAQKRWLFEAEGKEPSGDIHQAAFAQFSLLNKAPAVQQSAMEKLPIIAFLRDPFLRLASAYCNKLVSTLNHPSATAIEGVAVRRGVRLVRDTTVPFGAGSDQFSACSQIDYARGISFREFVEYIAATPDIELVGSRFANDIALWERVTSGSAASQILEARASCAALTRAG